MMNRDSTASVQVNRDELSNGRASLSAAPDLHRISRLLYA